ncbi:MAG: hypothetical protein A3H97_19890 [Acidobacteria bacterium RIFCSPLOWO2_02_FULL_65_29]|nr:MAG: hypothetical protein A3H97_19890 [Acidobacteria bacterium RIFCSPLOWO2_02_FULL_65_29]
MATVKTASRKVTFTELQGWPENGRRYELYDGEVYEVPAPFPRHQIALLELLYRLRDYALAHGGLVLASPIDIVFTEENVLQPDIVFFVASRRQHVRLDQVTRVPPDVAVEVISPSNAANDRGRKMETFERFGVQECWILDPRIERIEIYALRDGRYAMTASAGRGETFASDVLTGFTCAADTLFPW